MSQPMALTTPRVAARGGRWRLGMALSLGLTLGAAGVGLPASAQDVKGQPAAKSRTNGSINASSNSSASNKAAASAPASKGQALKLTLLLPADDPRLERSRIERESPGQPQASVRDALEVALKEAALELADVNLRPELKVVEVSDAAAAAAAAKAAEQQGAVVTLTDLPADATLAVAQAVGHAVINLGESSDTVREAQCQPRLFHAALSDRMKADALAQYLSARNWKQVLLLSGPLPADAVRRATVEAAIKRQGLKLVASKPFKISADPRERDLGNPLLLTGPSAGSYDVVWVVDSDGEFAQGLPYRTAQPRPVVGDAGLSALAWSPKFERYGGPQVTRRLFKAVGRRMGAHDWPAWLMGKSLAEAALSLRETDAKAPVTGAALLQALVRLEFDGSKGVSLSFRAWDGQLRQPVLLGDGHGVAATAPLDGVLHPRNKLDTLGADEPEKRCKARS